MVIFIEFKEEIKKESNGNVETRVLEIKPYESKNRITIKYIVGVCFFPLFIAYNPVVLELFSLSKISLQARSFA